MEALGILAIAAFAAAVIYLENWAIGQFLLGRPTLLLPVAALVFGHLELGLWMGLCLELLLLREMPLGATRAPDPVLGGFLGLIAVIFASASESCNQENLIFVALLSAILLSYLAGWHNHMQRKINTDFWYTKFQSAVQADSPERLERLFPLAMAGTLLVAFFFALVVLVVTPPVVNLGLAWLESSGRDPSYFKWAVLATAIGSGLKLGTGRKPQRLIVAGWVLGAILLFVMKGRGL